MNIFKNKELMAGIIINSNCADKPCTLAQVACYATQAHVQPADFPVMGADHRPQSQKGDLQQQPQAAQQRQRQHQWECRSGIGQADQDVLAGDTAEFPKCHQGILVGHVLQHLESAGQIKRMIGQRFQC